MISGRRIVLISAIVMGILLGHVLTSYFSGTGFNVYDMQIVLNVYQNGELIYTQRANSPVENFGMLHSAWLEFDMTGGQRHTVQRTFTRVDGTTNTLGIWAFYFDSSTNTPVMRYSFWLIDDSTPPAFSRNMYSPKDADSTVYMVNDLTSGYYVDTNGNLVIYIQSEVYVPSANQSIEAISLLMHDTGGNTDAFYYLLFYDLLSTPLDLVAGQAYQFEYQIVYP